MSKFQIYNYKTKSKQIYSYIQNYIEESLYYSHIYKKNFKKILEKKSSANKVQNLNHNGALLPKNEVSKPFFEIFEKFKPILKKHIPPNSLIHFPIIVRLNNVLANKKINIHLDILI